MAPAGFLFHLRFRNFLKNVRAYNTVNFHVYGCTRVIIISGRSFRNATFETGPELA